MINISSGEKRQEFTIRPHIKLKRQRLLVLASESCHPWGNIVNDLISGQSDKQVCQYYLFSCGWAATHLAPTHRCNYLSIQCLIARCTWELMRTGNCCVWAVIQCIQTWARLHSETFWFVFLKQLNWRVEVIPETAILILCKKGYFCVYTACCSHVFMYGAGKESCYL